MALNPATFAFLPMAAAGFYLLYRLWVPERGYGDGPSIEIGNSTAQSSAQGVYDLPQFNDNVPVATQSPLLAGPTYPIDHLPVVVSDEMTSQPESAVLDLTAAPLIASDVDEHDFSLDGLFQERDSGDAESKSDYAVKGALPLPLPEEVKDVSKDEKREKPERKRGLKNKVARFPFDVRVWEDPGTPRSVERAQKRAERAERLQQLDETRVAVSDAVSKGGGSLVLAEPVEEQSEMFADVWKLASGEATPDGVSEGVSRSSRRSLERSAKRAEREEKKLEKLRAKEDKRRSKETSDAAKESYVVTEDPWAAGAGAEAFINTPFEAGAPVVWVETAEPELPVTWDVGEATPDGVSEGVSRSSRRSLERSAKRAEREEKKLEKLRAKEDKRRSKETSDAAKESYVVTEDPWAAGAGAEAFINTPFEAGAPVVWVETAEPELPVTWDIDGRGASVGNEAATWEAAAAASGPLVPSATTISGDELLELGASIVIGTEPGAGDGAFYLPEGFEVVAEAEPKRRRIGRNKRETEDAGEVESVTDWAQGGVVLDPDEGVNYQDYDIPEPIPSRTIVLFGENEES